VSWHVYPINDICEHDTDGPDCICGPRFEEEGRLVIHNSLDGREQREQAKAARLARVRKGAIDLAISLGIGALAGLGFWGLYSLLGLAYRWR